MTEVWRWLLRLALGIAVCAAFLFLVSCHRSLRRRARSDGPLAGRAGLPGRPGPRHGARLAHRVALQRLLHGHLLREPLQRVLALQLLQLGRRVLVQELINTEEAASNSDVDAVLVDADDDALGAELVDALALAHKHDLELLAVGIVVDVLGEPLVHGVVFDRDVHGDARLQIDNVLLQRLDLVQQLLILELNRLQLLQKLQRGLLRLVELLLQLDDVGARVLQFSL